MNGVKRLVMPIRMAEIIKKFAEKLVEKIVEKLVEKISEKFVKKFIKKIYPIKKLTLKNLSSNPLFGL